MYDVDNVRLPVARIPSEKKRRQKGKIAIEVRSQVDGFLGIYLARAGESSTWSDAHEACKDLVLEEVGSLGQRPHPGSINMACMSPSRL